MITAKLLLYTYHKPTKKGYPLKILVTEQRQTKPVHLKRYCELQYWDEEDQEPLDICPDKRLAPFVKSHKKRMKEIVNEANERGYTLERVLRMMGEPIDPVSPEIKLLEFYELRIEELKKINKSTSAYELLQQQLKKYLDGRDIEMTKITYDWLRRFRDYKLMTTMENNGVHAYLRNIKTIYYEARRRGYVSGNPFDGVMPTLTKTKKLAIEEYQLKKLEEICPQDRTLLFLLMFYLGGMSLIDVSLLKWSQINNGRLNYYRYKLRRTGFEINIKIFPKAQRIIDLLGTPDQDRIFNWIPEGHADTRVKYDAFRGNYIKRFLRPIGVRIGTRYNLTTKAARHTFKTIGIRKGVEDHLLKEIMGHEDDSVDARYLDFFPDEMKDEALAKIIGEFTDVLS